MLQGGSRYRQYGQEKRDLALFLAEEPCTRNYSACFFSGLIRFHSASICLTKSLISWPPGQDCHEPSWTLFRFGRRSERQKRKHSTRQCTLSQDAGQLTK